MRERDQQRTTMTKKRKKKKRKRRRRRREKGRRERRMTKEREGGDGTILRTGPTVPRGRSKWRYGLPLTPGGEEGGGRRGEERSRRDLGYLSYARVCLIKG